MAAGLAQLRELERSGGYGRLEEMGRQMEEGMRGVLNELSRPLTFHRIGSMFCLYFTAGPVWNLADAGKSDLEAFRRFFHSCLQDGVYFAPSQFEAGFLSLMHTDADLERTLEVVSKNLRRACA
jgi:glutamate-1-semialdehyde 2,1-aminomutase